MARVAFLAKRDLIAQLIDQGYPHKVILDDNLAGISISPAQFSRYVKLYLSGGGPATTRASAPHPAPAPAPAVSAQPQIVPKADPRASQYQNASAPDEAHGPPSAAAARTVPGELYERKVPFQHSATPPPLSEIF